MKGRYKLPFLMLALLMMLTAVVAPLAAQGSPGEKQLVHFEHKNHCHLVSDCDATSFGGHAGPVLSDGIALSAAAGHSRPLALQEFSFASFFEPVPTPPPIA